MSTPKPAMDLKDLTPNEFEDILVKQELELYHWKGLLLLSAIINMLFLVKFFVNAFCH